MEKDIVPELLEKIRNEFKNKTEKSKIIKAKIAELKSKKVSHKDSNEFAIEVGNILKEVFKDNIKSDVLPDNKMYYNIAKRIIEPNLKNNYDLVVGYAGDVQDVLNKKAGINIAKQIPEINQEKIDNLIDKISEYDNFEDAKWLIDEPIVNFTQSVVDDFIKENVEFQYQSGLQPKIIRREAGNCCKWCANLAGVYSYPHDVPKDVWRRHRYCRCTVEYIPGDGRRQNVHTKEWVDLDKEDKIILRKEFNKIPNSTLNKYTIKKLEEKNWTPEFKAKSFKFYRETSVLGVEFTDHSVGRTIDRVINQNLMTQSEIVKLLKGKPNFIQSDGRLIYKRNLVNFVKNPNTGDIVSVIITDKVKSDWRKI